MLQHFSRDIGAAVGKSSACCCYRPICNCSDDHDHPAISFNYCIIVPSTFASGPFTNHESDTRIFYTSVPPQWPLSETKRRVELQSADCHFSLPELASRLASLPKCAQVCVWRNGEDWPQTLLSRCDHPRKLSLRYYKISMSGNGGIAAFKNTGHPKPITGRCEQSVRVNGRFCVLR